jgi:PST family polysaccharide transporter
MTVTAPPSPPSLAHRAVGSAGWSALGTAAMFASMVVSTVVLARLVDPVAFGVVAVAIACATLLRSVVLWSPAQALVRSDPLRREQVAAGTGLALAGGVAGAAVLAGLSVASPFPGGDAASWAFRGMALTLAVQAVGTVPIALLQRDLRFRRLSGIQAASSILAFCGVGPVLALAGAGAGALVGAQLVQATVETALVLHASRGRWVQPVLGGPDAAELFAFSCRLSGISASAAASQQGDNLVVSATLGSGPLGLYSRAFRLMALPANLFGDATDWVLLPVLSRVQGDRDRLARGLRQTTALLAVTVLPLSAAAWVLGEEVITVLLGERWSGAVNPFRILCLGMFLRVAYKPATVVLKATGHVRPLSRLMCGYAGLVVAGAVIGQGWGLAGVATGTVAAVAACYVGVTWWASRVTGVARRALITSLVVGGLLAVVSLALVGLYAGMARASALPDSVVLFGGAVVAVVVPLWALGSSALSMLVPELGWWRDLLLARLGGWRQAS